MTVPVRRTPNGLPGVACGVWEIQQPLTYDLTGPPPPPRGFLAACRQALREALDKALPGGPRYGRPHRPRIPRPRTNGEDA
ncbi:hypothetical protein [Yinghuangia soli]|uniref:Uncharacterized protein n=1 Tax=Yinghuangia soli TaxID=2908204 RepID=A0AA41PZ72_9ACTN|nr:hypothetical protein [Yinghuangia soli]MCF2528638.1 hypothetical protein [Yinghuangia soli]